MRLTRDEIEAAKTAKGGWTKATLEGWGISWPPPKGWKERLMDGYEPEAEPNEPESNPNGLEGKLLHEVVMAVIDAGHGALLAEIDALNAYYGNGMPTVESIVGARPKAARLEGGLVWDDKVFRFSVIRKVVGDHADGTETIPTSST